MGRQALNHSIKSLHKTPVVTMSDSATIAQPQSEDHADFSWQGWKPCTRGDVEEGLFGPGSLGMNAILDGDYDVALAQVLKFVDSVTRPGSPSEHFRKAVLKWRDHRGCSFTLGKEMASDRNMTDHGLVGILKRSATNSYKTAVMKAMLERWRIRWNRNVKVDKNWTAKPGYLKVYVGKHLPRSIQECFNDAVEI